MVSEGSPDGADRDDSVTRATDRCRGRADQIPILTRGSSATRKIHSPQNFLHAPSRKSDHSRLVVMHSRASINGDTFLFSGHGRRPVRVTQSAGLVMTHVEILDLKYAPVA